MLDTLVCGAVFGAALTASGVHQPFVILSQLRLENFHMVQSFLAAAATSTIFVTVMQRYRYVDFKPRCYSSLGLFGPLDGNIIGGLLQGTGMALAGACPGTLFAQVGNRIPTGFIAFGGALLGGLVWTGILRPLIQRQALQGSSDASAKAKEPEDLTVDKRLGLSQTGALLALESMFVAIVSTSVLLASPKSHGLVHPVVGGMLIGLTQLCTILMRKTLLGTSTSFEEVGDHFWWLLKGARRADMPKSHKNIVFTGGIMLGALALSLTLPVAKAIPQVTLNPLRVLLGGALLSIGARVGGGCTSGHGISGISLFSTSSFVTVMSMFAGGISTSMLLKSLL